MEDYTIFDEIDVAGNRLQNIAATSFSIVGLDNDESVRLTKQANPVLKGDFQHSFSLSVTASTSGVFYPWAATLAVTACVDQLIAASDGLCLKWNDDRTLTLTESNAGSLTSDSSIALSLNTPYYFRIARDELVGTYGKLYCFIYSDDSYATLVDSMSVTLTEKKDFVHLWAMSAVKLGLGGASITATMSNLNIDPYFYYTQKTLRTRLRDALNLASTSTVFFTDAQLNAILNEAQRDIAQKSLCLQDIIALSTSNAVRTISGMSSYYNLSTLEYNNVALKEIPVNLLGRSLPKTTTPEFYFENNDVVGVEPLPNATYNLSGYLSKPPTDMSADAQMPTIKPAFRQLIIPCALAKALMKKQSTKSAGEMFYILYLHELKYLAQEYLSIIPDSFEALNYYND